MRYTQRQLKTVRRNRERVAVQRQITAQCREASAFGQRIFAQVRLNNAIANGEYRRLH